MKQTISIILTCCILTAKAQKIALPKNLSTADSSLYTAMPAMAKQVLALYKESDKEIYNENAFRYLIAAEMYSESVAMLLENILLINDKGATGIQFRSYAAAKAAQKKDQRPFRELYTDTLAAMYNRLPESAKPQASGFFSGDPEQLKESLDKKLQKLAGKDSISLEDAKSIVRSYNSWNVYKQIKKPGTDFFAAEDARKYMIQDSMLIRMKDGGGLSAVIVRQRAITTPQPVILMYNIYAGAYDVSAAKIAANMGYVGMVINTRGKKLSPQEIEPFEHDAADIYEAIDWISKQPWCNGKVAMYGGSYLGFSQWSAVKKLHPALKTIVPQVAVGPGIDYPNHNGIFMSYMLRWIKYVSNNKTTDQSDFNDEAKWNGIYNKWYTTGASFRSLDTMDGKRNAVFQRWLDHPAYDSYWQSMVPYGKEFADINIPILTTTGYYDDDQRGAFYYFMQHQHWNKNANDYMLIGPWNHAGSQSTAAAEVGGYRIDSIANISINETVFQWFDHILRDSAMPARLKDHINYEVQGANEWRSAPNLKAMSNDSLIFYLSSTHTKDGYKLENKLPAIKNSIQQEVSYTDRQFINNNDLPVLDTALRVDESLKFISAPLGKDVIMNGSFETQINAVLNKKDIDIGIDLYELMADGKYFHISYFLGRASYLADRSRRQLLQPGKLESIRCNNSFFASRKISRGSRVVAVIGLNKTPGWEVNYGSGKDVSVETMAGDGQIPLEIAWENDSYIKIPILR